MDPSDGSRSLQELNELVAAQQVLIEQLTPSAADSRPPDPSPAAIPGLSSEEPAQVAVADEVVVHVPATCDSCGRDLADAEIAGSESHQVFDLPDVRIAVTDHVAELRLCTCGNETRARVAELEGAVASYGPGVRALAAYLVIYQHIPLDRTAQIFADVFGHEISVTSLARIVVEAQV